MLGLRWLFDNRYEFRFDDPPIGGHEAKAVNTGGRCDGPVGGIPQYVAQSRDLGGDLDIEGYNLESGAGIESGE